MYISVTKSSGVFIHHKPILPMARKKVKKKAVKKPFFSLNFDDDRIPKILGIICIFLALYLAIAFVSYIYTWKVDQDKVLKYSWQFILQGDLSVENWLGRLGAIVSNMFFYWGFGLPSIVFVFLLVKLGKDLIIRRPLSEFWVVCKNSMLLMAFFSLILEFAFRNSSFSWGGAFGESTYVWMSNFVGNIGLLLLIILTIIGTSVWYFNPNLEQLAFEIPGLSKLPGLEFLKNRPNTKEKRQAAKFITTDEPKASPTKEYTALQPRSAEATQRAIPKPEISSDDAAEPTGHLDFSVSEALSKISPKKGLKPEDAQLEINESAGNGEAISITDNVHPTPVVSTPAKPVLPIQEENQNHSEPYDPKLDLSNYEYPKLDFLADYDQKVEIDREELEANKNQIIETLLNYKIEITKIRATIGPTVTLYEIVPAPGVKISKIKNLEDDIALSLAALGIRIIAPIPGKGTIGIEVPNKKPQMVALKDVINTDKFQNAKMDLPIALGKTIANEVFIADLAKMPHLLIAGATGQGKSVGINTILMSLLYKKHPSQVKLVLIDPKKVELFPYGYLDQHFLGYLPNEEEPILTETKKVVYTLNSLCIEMDNRYDLLKKARARNIKEYNQKFTSRNLNPNNGHRFLPYIVLVIDEFADLIMTAGKEVEMPIARLAQLARAIGIHLIIATQRPSVNIITGIIKANFPARLAFKVTSKIDSRTILDQGGADQLIGRGDMLLSIGSNTVRLQCAFVDTPEVEKVINHIGDQQGFPEPFYLPEYVSDEDQKVGDSNIKLSDLDEKFEEAARMIVSTQQGSTSSIQRRLQLGYNRAGRIMDQMEAFGIVGPSMGSKPREVMFMSEAEFNAWWETMKK